MNTPNPPTPPSPPIQLTPRKFLMSRMVDERLKLFYILVRPEVLPLTCPKCSHRFNFSLRFIKDERIRGILSYRPEEALAFVKQHESKPGYVIVWTGDFSFLDEIVAKLAKSDGGALTIDKVETTAPPSAPEKPKPAPDTTPKDKKQFLWNLMMISDQMTAGVLAEKDQAHLKRIIGILEKNELKQKA